LSSQFAACSAEKASLKGIVETAHENSTSRRIPHVILEVVSRALTSEMWIEKISINGAELEIVGVAPRADDVERLVSSQEFAHNIVGVRIVSTHTDMRNGRQVFQLSAQAPPSLARGALQGLAYAF
jgi:Tfp pilus assembly protein PilN